MDNYDDDGYGPPTREDDWWFHEHVRAAGYPKVKRGDKPMVGQMVLGDTGQYDPRKIDKDADLSPLYLEPW